MKDLGNYFHITFATKYRRKTFLNFQKKLIANCFYDTCKSYQIELLMCVVEEDHVHILIEFVPKSSIAYIVNRIKSDSSRVFNRLYQKAGEKVWQNGFSCASVSLRKNGELQAYLHHHEKECIFEFSELLKG